MVEDILSWFCWSFQFSSTCLGLAGVSKAQHLGYARKFLPWPFSLRMFGASHWVLCHWCFSSFWGQWICSCSRRENHKDSSGWSRQAVHLVLGHKAWKREVLRKQKLVLIKCDYSTRKPSFWVFLFLGSFDFVVRFDFVICSHRWSYS